MIKLHYYNPQAYTKEVWVNPEKIEQYNEFRMEGTPAQDRTHLYTGGEHPISVTETAADISRLCAAWEQRFNNFASEGELPIFVSMDDDGIVLNCCEHTHKLNEELRSQAKAKV